MSHKSVFAVKSDFIIVLCETAACWAAMPVRLVNQIYREFHLININIWDAKDAVVVISGM